MKRPSRRERRGRLLELLGRRDLPALRALAREEPTLTSALAGLLNERDDLSRWRAIEALGAVATELARADLEAVRDLVRRQLWAMNDESGNVPWHAAEAVGEVLCRVPALAPEFLSILVSHREMPIFRAGVAFALDRLAATQPALVRAELEALLELARDDAPAARGHAARALGALGGEAARVALAALGGDAATFTRYDFETGALVEERVGARWSAL